MICVDLNSSFVSATGTVAGVADDKLLLHPTISSQHHVEERTPPRTSSYCVLHATDGCMTTRWKIGVLG